MERDLEKARAARDEGFQKVARLHFMQRGRRLIELLPAGEYMGEDVRAALEAQGLFAHHANAWGALIQTCVRHEILRRTDTFRQMRKVSSHARVTRVYVKDAPAHDATATLQAKHCLA